MIRAHTARAAGKPPSRRLFVYNGGFLTQKRIRRILTLAGWDIRLGKPGPDDWVGVWGKSPTSPRGEARGRPHRRPDPAGRGCAAALGPARARRRAAAGPASGHPRRAFRQQRALGSRNPAGDRPAGRHRPAEPRPRRHRPDQIRASVEIQRLRPRRARAAMRPMCWSSTRPKATPRSPTAGRMRRTFQEMLFYAQEENPGARIVIKTHPETAGRPPGRPFRRQRRQRPHHPADRPGQPVDAVRGRAAVYTVTSGLGFEAILAGHKPRVFGQPFYAGWGLTQDEFPVPRRKRHLTRAQLFAATMILYPTWYDPYRDRLCDARRRHRHAGGRRPAPGARITRAMSPSACACGNAARCNRSSGSRKS